MGREDTPRRLWRKRGDIFWPGLFPAGAAGAHPPGPRAHVGVMAIGLRGFIVHLTQLS